MDKQHLTVNDIVIGDYVQEWLKIPGKWSMPMYVDGIFGEGDLYLNFDGNEADPWDANVKNVFDIPVDFGILPHFGFVEVDHHVFQLTQGDWSLTVCVLKPFHFVVTGMLFSKDGKCVILGDGLDSIRTIQHRFYDETKQPLKLVFE